MKENLSISVKDLQSGQDIMSYIWLYDSWPSIVTLTLNWHMGNWAKIKDFFPLV